MASPDDSGATSDWPDDTPRPPLTFADLADSLDPAIAAARADHRHGHADALAFAQRWLRVRDLLHNAPPRKP